MPENRHPNGLKPESDHPLDAALWQALERVPQHEPSENLRRSFYHRLGEATRPSPWQRLTALFQHPLVPALATLVIGLALGSQLRPAPSEDLNALKEQVATLNTTVALTLLGTADSSERLRGIHVAAELGGRDPRLADALLKVAATEHSASVRSAAASALGPYLSEQPDLADRVELLLRKTQSPLVQLALVELLMRYGDYDRQRRLIDDAESGRLLPDVNEFIQSRVERNQA